MNWIRFGVLLLLLLCFVTNIKSSSSIVNKTFRSECCIYQWNLYSNVCSCGDYLGDLLVALPIANNCSSTNCKLWAQEPQCSNITANSQLCCRQNCTVGIWSSWSSCEGSCNALGKRTRQRNIINEMKCGGLKCPITLESESCRPICNNNTCLTSSYSQWSTCSSSCGNGTSFRFRKNLRAFSCNPNDCVDEPPEIRPCTNFIKVDCLLSSWSPWSTCRPKSAVSNCGKGIKSRTRQIIQPALCNGAACRNLEETIECINDCCPKNRSLSEWSLWSNCSEVCNSGSQIRFRTVVQPSFCNSHSSPTPPEDNTIYEKRDCKSNAQKCQELKWTPWSNCTSTCGDGIQSRQRILDIDSDCLSLCGSISLYETKFCKDFSSRRPYITSEWSNWSNCTRTCPSGVRHRTRTILYQAECANSDLPSLYEEKSCHLPLCPKRCVAGACVCENGQRFQLNNTQICEPIVCKPLSELIPSEYVDNETYVNAILTFIPQSGELWSYGTIARPTCSDPNDLFVGDSSDFVCQIDGTWSQEWTHAICKKQKPILFNISLTTTEVSEAIAPNSCFSQIILTPTEVVDIEYNAIITITSFDNPCLISNKDSLTNITWLCTTCQLDYETTPNKFNISIKVLNKEMNVSETNFTITVIDFNDPPTKCEFLGNDLVFVHENSPPGFIVGKLKIDDVDSQAGDFLVQIIDSDNGNFDVIMDNSNNNFVVQVSNNSNGFNFEKQRRHWFTLVVTDLKIPIQQIFCKQIVEVRNVNDPPSGIKFKNKNSSEIYENTQIGSSFTQLLVLDEDENSNHTVILLNDYNGTFKLFNDSTSYHLVVNKTLNYENPKDKNITLLFQIIDNGNPSFTVNVYLPIFLLDINENPYFQSVNEIILTDQTKFEIEINENTNVGSVVVAIVAIDPDEYENLTLTTNNDLLSVKSKKCRTVNNKGIWQTQCAIFLMLNLPLDFETVKIFNINLILSDKSGPSNNNKLRLTIKVLDANDKPKSLMIDGLETQVLNVTEKTGPLIIGILSVEDADQTNNQNYTYQLIEDDSGVFDIVNSNELKLVYPLIYQPNGNNKVNLIVLVTDNGTPPPQYVEIVLTINILNVNDAPLDIELSNNQLAENSTVGSVIGTLACVELDENDTCQFELLNDCNGTFSLDNNTNQLLLQGQLDYESVQLYIIEIKATDNGNPPLSIIKVFPINIIDSNDSPIFISTEIDIVLEQKTGVFVVGSVLAIDLDEGHQNISYELITTNSPFVLSQDDEIGASIIFKNGTLNYEKESYYLLNISARDDGVPAAASYAIVNITVRDCNDLTEFDKTEYIFHVTEYKENPAGHRIKLGVIRLSDNDKNETIRLRLLQPSLLKQIVILELETSICYLNTPPTQPESFCDVAIFLNSNAIDFESQSEFVFIILATDKYNMEIERKILLIIHDKNEAPTNVRILLNSVRVLFREFDIKENEKTVEIGTISADDEDFNQSHNFEFYYYDNQESKFPGIFVDQNGVLKYSGNGFDFEIQSKYELLLVVTDSGSPPLNYSVKITLNIINVNEPPGRVYISNNKIAELSSTGTVIGILTSTDPDLNDHLTFVLLDDACGRFGIFGNSELRVKNSLKLDYEIAISYEIMVGVKDSGSPMLTDNTTLVIHILPVNEPPTEITLDGRMLYGNAPAGTVIGQLGGKDPDVNDTLTFHLVPSEYSSLFSITLTSVGTYQLVRSNNTNSISLANVEIISLSIQVQDQDNLYLIHLFEIIILKNPLTFTVYWLPLHDDDYPTNYPKVEENQANILIGTLQIVFDKVENVLDLITIGVKNPINFPLSIGNKEQTNERTFEYQLKLNKKLNFEEQSSYVIELYFHDETNNPDALVPFYLQVVDVNEEPEGIVIFPWERLEVYEDAVFATFVGRLLLQDPDQVDHYGLNFQIIEQNPYLAMDILGYVNVLPPGNVIDYEMEQTIQLQVSAQDSANHVIQRSFTVHVLNVNEVPVKATLSTNIVAENSASGTVVGRIVVDDPDNYGQFQPGQTHIASLIHDSNGRFKIVNGLDLVVVNDATECRENQLSCPLNYEMETKIVIVVKVTDSGEPPLSAFFSLEVKLTDVAEAPTDILLQEKRFGNINVDLEAIAEHTLPGTVVGFVTVIHEDPNASYECSFTTNQVASHFILDKHDNSIRISEFLNYEIQSKWSLPIRCFDTKTTLAYEKTFVANVIDTQEAPYFISTNPQKMSNILSVKENLASDESAGTIYIKDNDKYDEITVFCHSNDISLVLTCTNVTCQTDVTMTTCQAQIVIVNFDVFNQKLDKALTFTVIARDSSALSKTQQFVISTKNQDDIPQELFIENILGVKLTSPYLTIDENSKNLQIGTLHVIAKDNQLCTFTLLNDTLNGFEVKNQNQLWIQESAILNFEDKETNFSYYILTIEAKSSTQQTIQKTFYIEIGDVNEFPENLFLSNRMIYETIPGGSFLGHIIVNDPDTLNPSFRGPYTFVVDDNNNDACCFVNEGDHLILKEGQKLKPSNMRIIINVFEDGLSNSIQLPLEIFVLNDSPADVGFTGSLVVDENSVSPFYFGQLTSSLSSIDSPDIFFIDNSAICFITNTNSLYAAIGFNYEKNQNYSFNIRSQNRGFKSFIIEVKDLNDSPILYGTNARQGEETVEIQEGNENVNISTVCVYDEDFGDTVEIFADLPEISFQKLRTNPSWARNDEQSSCWLVIYKPLLDFESKSWFDVRLTCLDSKMAMDAYTIHVLVQNVQEPPKNFVLLNGNDNDNVIVISVTPFSHFPMQIGKLKAFNEDVEDFVIYEINQTFACEGAIVLENATSGIILLTGTINQLNVKPWFTVQASDNHGQIAETILNITIEIINENNFSVEINITFNQVPHWLPKDTELGQLIVTNETIRESAQVICSASLGPWNLVVDKDLYIIVNENIYIPNINSTITLFVECWQNGNPKIHTNQQQFELSVLLSDKEPRKLGFLAYNYTSDGRPQIMENLAYAPVGNLTYIGIFSGNNLTTSMNLVYSIESSQLFFVDSETNILFIAGALDHEIHKSVSLLVTVKEGKNLVDKILISFSVGDCNETPLGIRLFITSGEEEFSVNLDSPEGLLIATWQPLDPDTTLCNNYTLEVVGISPEVNNIQLKDLFTITSSANDNSTSVTSDPTIRVGAGLRNVSPNEYTITILLVDYCSLDYLEVTETFSLKINDNNVAPQNITLTLFNQMIAEDTPIGSVIGEVQVNDRNIDDSHNCTTDSLFLKITLELEVVLINLFNYEAQHYHSFNIYCKDKGGLSVQQRFTLYIDDINEKPSDPTISNVEWLESLSIGSRVASISAIDPENYELTFTLIHCTPTIADSALPCPMSLQSNNSSNLILTSSLSLWPGSTLFFTYEIKDSQEEKLIASHNITILRHPLSLVNITFVSVNLTENCYSHSVAAIVEITNPLGIEIKCTLEEGNDQFVWDGENLLTQAGVVFDYEINNKFLVVLKCFPISDPSVFIEREYFIMLINENEPLQSMQLFSLNNFSTTTTTTGELHVKESHDIQQPFARLYVMEDDTDIGQVYCKVENDDYKLEAITSNEPPQHQWNLYKVGESFDFETESSVSLTIDCVDDSKSGLKEKWEIIVDDENESPIDVSFSTTDLVIDLDQYWTNESFYLGEFIISDLDLDQNHTIVILCGESEPFFMIDENTFSLYARSLSHVWLGKHTIDLLAIDNGTPQQLSFNFSLTFNIIQSGGSVLINDKYQEELSILSPMGTMVGKLTFPSKESTGFKLIDSANFIIDQQTNQLYSKTDQLGKFFIEYLIISVEAFSIDTNETITISPLRINLIDQSLCRAKNCPLHSHCERRSKSEEVSCVCDHHYVRLDNNNTCSLDPTAPCQVENNPCKNNATCQPDEQFFFGIKKEKPICICSSGYSGDNCDVPIHCSKIPCIHGFCTPVNGSSSEVGIASALVCQCYPGYSGRYCEKEINECQEWQVRCENNGKCIDRNCSYVCECPSKWIGERCQYNIDKLKDCNCSTDNPICIPMNGEFVCANDGSVTTLDIQKPRAIMEVDELKSVFFDFIEKLSSNETKALNRRRRRSIDAGSSNEFVYVTNVNMPKDKTTADVSFVTLNANGSVVVPKDILSKMTSFCNQLGASGEQEVIFCPALIQQYQAMQMKQTLTIVICSIVAATVAILLVMIILWLLFYRNTPTAEYKQF